jgi:hypothetical protein
MQINSAKGFLWGCDTCEECDYKLWGKLSADFLKMYIYDKPKILTEYVLNRDAPAYAKNYKKSEDDFINVNYSIDYNFNTMFDDIDKLLNHKLYNYKSKFNYKVAVDAPHIIVVYTSDKTDCVIDKNKNIILNKYTEMLIRHLWKICDPRYNLRIGNSTKANSEVIAFIVNNNNILINNNNFTPAPILKRQMNIALHIFLIAIIIFGLKRMVSKITLKY